MKRTLLVFTLLILISLTLSIGAGAAPAPDPQPDIIVQFMDELDGPGSIWLICPEGALRIIHNTGAEMLIDCDQDG